MESNSARYNNSYAYNVAGADFDIREPVHHPKALLGLGTYLSWNYRAPIPAISEAAVRFPSEMFAMADARVLITPEEAVFGPDDYMVCSELWGEDSRDAGEVRTPRHGKGYNVLSCDAHVELLGRRTWLRAERSAQRWNNDHETHQEFWLLQGP